MSITDELRAYADGVKSDPDAWIGPGDEFKAIADRIDERHKRAVDKAHADGERNALQQRRGASEDYRRGYEKGMADGLDVGFADALAEQGWIKLPVDADGVPIRIDDEMRVDDQPVWSGHRVVGMELRDTGRWSIDLLGYGISALRPECAHHTQTVEDVLRKFYRDFDSIHGYGPDEKEVVEKYADLLQLKEVDA